MTTTSKDNLVSALIAARQSFRPVLKTKVNPFFKSKYADLDAVCVATDRALCDNGLVVMQYMDCGDPTAKTDRKYGVVELTGKDGAIERVMDVTEASGPSVFLVTEIRHVSGESRISRYPISPGLDPQALGSAITYARRYALMAILGIAAEDDDGNSASGRNGRKVETIGPGQEGDLEDLIADSNADRAKFLDYFHINALSELPVNEYQRAVKLLEKKRSAA